MRHKKTSSQRSFWFAFNRCAKLVKATGNTHVPHWDFVSHRWQVSLLTPETGQLLANSRKLTDTWRK